jgi:hypothetical protein
VPKPRVKTGRLSKAETDYIVANAGRMTPQDIAGKLTRSVDVVLKVLADLPEPDKGPESPTRSNIRVELKQSAAWKQFIEALTAGEVEYAEEQFVAYMEQFRDVLATEQNQIFKLVHFEILKHRNAVKQKRSLREIARLEREQELVAHKGMDDDEKEWLLQLDTQLNSANAQQAALANEYVKLEEKHQRLMEALKATRQQRIDRIETGKVNFLDLIKQLAVEETADREGRQAELMRKAAEKEMRRLGTPHRFGDGLVDQPILSADTAEMLDTGVVSLPEVEGALAARDRKRKKQQDQEQGDGADDSDG